MSNYDAQFYNGEFEAAGEAAISEAIARRFWAKVDWSERITECWEWTAATYSNGYGHFGLSRDRGVLAHRFAWELLLDEIPPGMHLDHRCHNRTCVNPKHLRLATAKQNLENPGVLRGDNTSGVRGVSWHKRAGKWRAQVQHHGRPIHVGLFEDIDDAEQAVVAMRVALFTHNDMDRRLA